MNKVDSAEIAINGINPEVKVVKYTERLTSENVMEVISGYDVILDGTDNFPTRYLLNDASLVANIPVVHGSIYQFEGSVTVYKPFEGPCYRCQYPEPPPPELAPSCAEGGVLGILPGVIGSLQATEVDETRARHRQPAGRPSAALRRARDGVHRAQACGAIPTAPCAARIPPRSSSSTTSSSARCPPGLHNPPRRLSLEHCPHAPDPAPGRRRGSRGRRQRRDRPRAPRRPDDPLPRDQGSPARRRTATSTGSSTSTSTTRTCGSATVSRRRSRLSPPSSCCRRWPEGRREPELPEGRTHGCALGRWQHAR